MPVFTGTPGDDGIAGTPGDDTMSGLAGNDVLIGNAGNDIIDGGDDHDILRGRDGNDTLTGGNGDDYLQGGEGDDVMDGGAGVDRAAFLLIATDPQVGATVDLNIQGVAQNTGHGFDTLIGIENVSGTVYDDVLTGDGGDNWIWGEAGNDILSGGGGNDLLEVGQGAATVDGGSGSDTLSFFNNQDFVGGVNVSLLLQGSAQTVYAGSSMTLSGIENLSGSDFNDTLTGDGGNNLLAGSGGSDTLSGGAGNDTLYGDGKLQVDTHNTGASGPITTYTDVDAQLGGGPIDGDDVLMGGAGSDLLNGGGGVDTASFADLAAAVVVNMNSGIAASGADTDTMVSIENIVGTAFDDTIVGNAGDNGLSGGDGNDSFNALDGNDTVNGGNGHDYERGGNGNDVLNGDAGDDYLRGGEGDDTIAGGSGFDRAAFVTADVGASLTGATVDLNIVGVAQNTGHGMDTLSGIEHVSGTDYNDTLIGDGGDNWIWGEGGNDVLTGNGGNDLLEVGEGNSTLNGGSGSDTASFFDNLSFASGVNVSLAVAGAQAVAAGSSMTLTSIENLSGSDQNDILTGNNAANTLAGSVGNDTLNGGDGDDLLLGDGQTLADTHNTGFSGPIVTVNDVFAFDGSSVDGNDTLNGGKGNDTLIGGGGNDTLTGDQGDDTFAFYLGSGHDVVTDYKKNADKFDLHGWGAYTVTQVGKDVLISNGTDNILVQKAKASDVSADITASISKMAPTSALLHDDGTAGSYDARSSIPNAWTDEHRGDAAMHDWFL